MNKNLNEVFSQFAPLFQKLFFHSIDGFPRGFLDGRVRQSVNELIALDA
jgi:hypothetical protein